MLWVSVLCLCAALISAQPGRINTIEHHTLNGANGETLTNILRGYELFEPPANGFANPANVWTTPLAPNDQLPASARTFTYLWNPRFTALGVPFVAGHRFANVGPSNLGVDQLNGPQQLTFRFANALGAGDTPQIKLEAPLLEVEPSSCGGAIGAARSCRCNLAAANGVIYEVEANKVIAGAIPVDRTSITFDMPVHTYFEHAPIPNQNPYLRTYRRICYRPDVNSDWVDTTMYFSVVHGCVDDLTDAGNLDAGNHLRCNVASQIDPAANAAQLLQIRGDNANPPNIRNVNVNEPLGYLGDFFTVNGLLASSQQIAAAMPMADQLNGQFEIFGESEEMRDARLQRTTCCGSLGNNLIQGITAQAGTCIDTTISSCCGRRPYDLFHEKCCSRRDSRIGRLDLPCPCVTTTTFLVNNVVINQDCNNEGANVFVPDDTIGFGQPVTTDRTCCAITKYPTWLALARFQNQIFPQAGFCVLNTPNAANPWRCCDDGNIYDPASAQCCPINGVQTLNIPCPCSADVHCPQNDGPQRCCVQYFPPVYPPNVGPQNCNAFANYPMPGAPDNSEPQIDAESPTYHSPRGFPFRGPVPYTSQYVQSFCPGQCYRQQWQICCNGNLCINEYERCCNATCCNMFTSKCTEGQRPGAIAARANALNYNVWFEVCTAKENLTARRAFFVFALPILLLAATLAGLAIVTVLARRATEHTFDLTEKVLVLVAAVSVLIACMFFFSPNWKYGIFIAFVDIAAIMISVIRKRRYSLLLVILLIIKMLFLLDPFGGNIFFSFTGGVPQFSTGPLQDASAVAQGVELRRNTQQEPINMVGRVDLSSSLFEATQRLWWNQEDCVRFYDYFMFDDNVRDWVRLDNPEKMTFGYCSRAWVTTLLIMTALLYLLQFLLLLLAIFSLAKKFGRKPSEIIQLEVVQENAPVVVA